MDIKDKEARADFRDALAAFLAASETLSNASIELAGPSETVSVKFLLCVRDAVIALSEDRTLAIEVSK